ncbi:hypothetical protein K491DRAFT_592622 [Lophiostoma macrostomum CBS 122681]|uniref:Uncharacterized protein n=1 Tax=Lophiostoma macrostomum CBS 122681 TaxID=1314788 RepID=A0A6A6TH70_9PLEO|nr:hypothetical protein K491DRAFT_592622 [Lophiostoma macrostomum CBS 122681]
MSTAIALQDIEFSDSGGLRRRRISNGDIKTTTSSSENGRVRSPQDETTSALTLDLQPFRPTTTYWISPHGMLSREIKILDLTRDMDVPFTGFSNVYKDQVKKVLKNHSFTPPFSICRDSWLGLRYTIRNSQGDILAKWKHPWSSVGEATLTFPEHSLHSSHTISLKNKRWGFRTETFTVDSTLFVWKMDSLWHSTKMTLLKVYGSGEHATKIEVGKYAQKWWGGFVTGGTFVINEHELDGLVAYITRHGKEVHSRQLTDHVVQQIDLLYWEAGTPSLDPETDASLDMPGEESTTLNQGDDLTLDRHIAKLPATWELSADHPVVSESENVDQDAYMNAASRVQDLSTRRLTLQQKLNTYQTLLSLLEPFRKPQENIQPNLVTRDAPLGPEMAKTRTLAIRVAGRVSEKFGDVRVPSTEEEDIDMGDTDSNAKLQKILSTW